MFVQTLCLRKLLARVGAALKGVNLIKISLTHLGTSNSKFRLNLTQRVTGSLFLNAYIYIYIYSCIPLVPQEFILNLFLVEADDEDLGI